MTFYFQFHFIQSFEAEPNMLRSQSEIFYVWVLGQAENALVGLLGKKF